jgi:hypothetical protein
MRAIEFAPKWPRNVEEASHRTCIESATEVLPMFSVIRIRHEKVSRSTDARNEQPG